MRALSYDKKRRKFLISTGLQVYHVTRVIKGRIAKTSVIDHPLAVQVRKDLVQTSRMT